MNDGIIHVVFVVDEANFLNQTRNALPDFFRSPCGFEPQIFQRHIH